MFSSEAVLPHDTTQQMLTGQVQIERATEHVTVEALGSAEVGTLSQRRSSDKHRLRGREHPARQRLRLEKESGNILQRRATDFR